MTIKDWWVARPIWLRGGIIALLVYIWTSIILILFGTDGWFPTWSIPTLLGVAPITWIIHSISGKDLMDELLFILPVITYFTIGAIVGIIIKKIKKNSTPKPLGKIKKIILIFLLLLPLLSILIYFNSEDSLVKDMVVGPNIVNGKVYAYQEGYWGGKQDYYLKEVKEADVDSFRILEYGYALDKKYVYRFHGNEEMYFILPNADSETFEILSQKYTKDNQQVYVYNTVIIGADSETFKIIGGDYTRDNKNVFFLGQIIPEADVETFEVIYSEEGLSRYAKDKNHYYYGRNIQEDIPDEQKYLRNI